MKRINKITMAITMAVLLAGCNGEPEVVQQTGDFRVGRLFTIDGCTAYRFSDGGRLVYFTNCPGVTDQRYTSGKNTYDRQVSTSSGEYRQ